MACMRLHGRMELVTGSTSRGWRPAPRQQLSASRTACTQHRSMTWHAASAPPRRWATAHGSAAGAVKLQSEKEVSAQFEANRPMDPSKPAAAPWRFSNVSIHTIEHVLPPVVVSSQEIMQRLGTGLRAAGLKPDALERITGIRERRMWEEGTTVLQAATWAAQKALESSGIDPSRIGVICNTSVCLDTLEPGMAVSVHHHLGLPASCINLDITNACVGMMNGMLMVASMIESGMCDYGLVVNAELTRELYEATMGRMCHTFNLNELASLTTGCGAAAAVLCCSDLAPPGRNHRLTGAVARCTPYCHEMCRGNIDNMVTDPNLVLHGVMVIKQTWEAAQEALGLSNDNVDLLVPHQVSKKAHDLIRRVCGGTSPDKVVSTYPYRGSNGPASIAIALSAAVEEQRLQEGMRVALVAVGSGVNCIVAEVIW